MNSSASSCIVSSGAEESLSSAKSFQKEQLDKLEEVLLEFPLPLCVECCQHDKIENSIIGYIQPDFSVIAEICTDGEMRKEVYPNCMAFVAECFSLWEYEQPYLDMTSAQGILRALFVGRGAWKDMSLWHMYRRFPGNMEDAGYTKEQMTCRRLLGNIKPGLPFGVRGKRITLESNHLFSYRKFTQLTCAKAVEVATRRVVSEEEALTMIFLSDNDDGRKRTTYARKCRIIVGYDKSLEEILYTFPLFKMQFLGQTIINYDEVLMNEINSMLAQILAEPTKDSKIWYANRMIDFFYDNCIDFIRKHPQFYEAVVAKCHELLKECSGDVKMCASCQRLLDVLLATPSV